MIELIEGLYQSGSPDFNEVIKENIEVVVHLGELKNDFTDNASPQRKFQYIWWPIEDGPVPDTRILNDLADLAVGFLKEGLKVLISCAAGINRSNLLACLIMMKFLGMDAKEAVEEIRKKNPLALINPNFYSWFIPE